MSKTQARWLLVALVAVLGVLLVVSAQAQTVSATVPRWVAKAPATGSFIPAWKGYAAGDTLARASGALGLIQVYAVTETQFTAYYWRPGKVPHYVKQAVSGYAASDSCYTIPAGQTQTFLFPRPGVQYLLIKSGEANFSGE